MTMQQQQASQRSSIRSDKSSSTMTIPTRNSTTSSRSIAMVLSIIYLLTFHHNHHHHHTLIVSSFTIPTTITHHRHNRHHPLSSPPIRQPHNDCLPEQQQHSLRHIYHNPSSFRLHLDGKGMAGGTMNKHLLGDVLRALQPRYLSQMTDALGKNLKGATTLQLDAFSSFLKDNDDDDDAQLLPPSWEDLSLRLATQQTKDDERLFRHRLSKGLEHNALASHRRFYSDNNGPLPLITLYRDAASWCPYCQKVWIALEELRLNYDIVRVDMNCYAGGSKPSEFLDIQPSGNLPCVVISHSDGSSSSSTTSNEVIGESDDILERIDQLAASSSSFRLCPFDKGSAEDYHMKYLCNDGRQSLERRLYAEWMWYLTGVRKPVEYRMRYEGLLDELNRALSPGFETPSSYTNDDDDESLLPSFKRGNDGPFLFGNTLTLADIKFIPFVERQEASLAYFKGFSLRNKNKWPYIVRWLEAMESRESYIPTKSDYYTHSRTLPPQLSGGCSFGDGCDDARDEIDALSLPTTSSSSRSAKTTNEWGWNNNEDRNAARREAAERVIANHDNIIKFACRSAGTPGLPAAAAPLADPRAVGNEMAVVPVDVLLRHVVSLLLENNSSDETSKRRHNSRRDDFENGVARALLLGDGRDDDDDDATTLRAVVDCLDYLRARVGVPRDMSYPAAQELKMELRRVTTVLLMSAAAAAADDDVVAYRQ